MSDINPGDSVELKSGGPTMSVQAINLVNRNFPGDYVQCVWFVDGKKMEDAFLQASLKKVDPDEPGSGSVFLTPSS